MRKPLSILVVLALVVPAGAPAHGEQSGLASVYGYSGSRTASGERAHRAALTATHRSLPFGTRARVTNHRNRRSVVLRINDRGPFRRRRIIDGTPSAAQALPFSRATPVSPSVT